MRTSLKFVRNGRIVELAQVGVNETLLDYLRGRQRACGTKEGCAEGDCGACTVVLGTLCTDGTITYAPVNACITLLAMIDGKELVVVDDLSASGDALHPVQRALVDHHGSQCGFCTPGFVMSLFALYHSPRAADRSTINDQLAGNLCRCTGYRPIVAAGLAVCTGSPDDRFTRHMADTARLLAAINDGKDLFIGSNGQFIASPASVSSLARLYTRHPDATLMAGATDTGLWITKQLCRLPKVICIGRAAGFDAIKATGNAIEIGAGATYAQAAAALAAIDDDLGEVVRRIGSTQVRSTGTIGGNIANGSPIGDTPPMLIALGATLHLRSGRVTRTMALEDFFIAYGKQDIGPGEFVEKITVPHLAENQHLRCYKIAKRFDQDISAVLATFCITLAGRTVTQARIAFGGMAATPKRAAKTERAIAGLNIDDEAAFDKVLACLDDDFQPLSDMRASARYRLQTAQALLFKALHEVAHTGTGAPPRTRITGQRGVPL